MKREISKKKTPVDYNNSMGLKVRYKKTNADDNRTQEAINIKFITTEKEN